MRRRKVPSFALVPVILASFATIDAISLSPPSRYDPPNLNYHQLGDVYLAGRFNGISLITYDGQQKMLLDPENDKDSLVVQYSQDVFTTQKFADGSISSSCLLGDNATVVIAGTFTQIFNTSVRNSLAAVNLVNEFVTPIGDAINGSEVNTLYCNGSQVYIGGSFAFQKSNGIAVWNQDNNSLQLPAFGGFVEGSTVSSIVPYGNNIVFGGNFSGLASINSANSTKSASGLLDPGMQPVSFSLATATGYSSQTTQTGSDASSLFCPLSGGNGWTAALDSTTGYVNVTLAYMSQPTLIRLFNLADVSGTKAFRIISEPAGSFMNLTYTDERGNVQSCSAECPLLQHNSSVRHTDFAFVNVVPTTSLKIQLLDFYGDRAGLKGLQLFEEGQFTFAYNAFNDPRQCDSVNESTTNEIVPSSSATSQLEGGNGWKLVEDFMTTSITSKSKLTKAYAQFTPTFESYTVNEGKYEVLIYTPGCKPYGTCGQRGKINVTVFTGSGTPISTILYQTNQDFKYDVVYNGTLQQGAFVRLTPVSRNNVPMEFVAYKVSLKYLGNSEKYEATNLFEYAPSNFTNRVAGDVPIGRTAINEIGKALGTQALVNSVLLNGTSALLVGGANFPSNVSDSSNLFLLALDDSQSPSTGISGADAEEGKITLFSTNDTTYATTSKQAYRLSGQSLVSLRTGPIAGVSHFRYNNTQFDLLSSASGDNVSVWNPRTKSQDTTGFYIAGHVSSMIQLQNVTVYTGSIQLANSVSPDVTVLSESSEVPKTPTFEILSRKSDLDRRDVEGDLGKSLTPGSLLGGLYLNSSDVIVYGHFNATTSSNEPAANALFVSGTESRVLFGSEYQLSAESSTFSTAVAINDSLVFMGGCFEGSVNGTEAQSALLFSQQVVRQPEELNPENDVTILVAEVKPNTTDVMVGGDFSSGKGVSNASCNGVCMYLTNESKWVSPAMLALDPGSKVSALVFETESRVIMGGNFCISDKPGQVAVYEFANASFEVLPPLPGPVNKVIVITNATHGPVYVAAGTDDMRPFIRWISRSHNSWQNVPNMPFVNGTSINTISLVSLNSTTANEGSPFNSSNALLVSGQLMLSSGPASVVSYDGNNWNVMYATTGGYVRSVFAQHGGNLNGGVSFKKSRGQPHNRGHQGNKKPMAVGHVVGIACAIGVCCVLALMLFYVLCESILNCMNDGIAYQNLAHFRPSSDGMEGTKIVK